MQKIYLFLKITLILLLASESFSQAVPTLQISVGLLYPDKTFKGELVSTNNLGISNINPDFIKNNYAASTGVAITGTIKFPLEHNGIFSGLLVGSYSYFNAFRRSFLGTTIENNISVPVTFDDRFSTSTFGIGIEASPFSSQKISPFLSADFTLNILSLSLSKNDLTSVIFNDAFRMGILTNAGLLIKVSSEYSIVLSGSYDLSNLILKGHSEDINNSIGFNKEGLSINDQQGTYYSNISTPGSLPVLINGNNKNVNWWGLSVGLNIRLGKSKKK